MTLKQKIYKHYLSIVCKKTEMLEQVLADLKESSANETKSTAGDKHETALAMLQTEQAQVRAQLKTAQEQQGLLQKINPYLSPATIGNGSLIKTNKGYLFIAVALGKAVIEGNEVIALSLQSPLGSQLPGLQVGDTVVANTQHYLIESIE